LIQLEFDSGGGEKDSLSKSVGIMQFGVNGKIWVEDNILKWIIFF